MLKQFKNIKKLLFFKKNQISKRSETAFPIQLFGILIRISLSTFIERPY